MAHSGGQSRVCPGQSDLGSMYANAEGVDTDYSKALKWFRLAADQGEASAQNNLGEMYANGQGVDTDYARLEVVPQSCGSGRSLGAEQSR